MCTYGSCGPAAEPTVHAAPDLDLVLVVGSAASGVAEVLYGDGTGFVPRVARSRHRKHRVRPRIEGVEWWDYSGTNAVRWPTPSVPEDTRRRPAATDNPPTAPGTATDATAEHVVAPQPAAS